MFLLLLSFWFILSAEIDFQHLAIGVLVALSTTWFWGSTAEALPSIPTFREFLGFGRCLWLLLVAVVESNISVARIVLSGGECEPRVFRFQPELQTNWGRVFVANCITLTPGTVTVDLNPDNGEFTIYALGDEQEQGVFAWRLIEQVRKLEAGRMVAWEEPSGYSQELSA